MTNRLRFWSTACQRAWRRIVEVKDHVELAALLVATILVLVGLNVGLALPPWLLPSVIVSAVVLLILDSALLEALSNRLPSVTPYSLRVTGIEANYPVDAPNAAGVRIDLSNNGRVPLKYQVRRLALVSGGREVREPSVVNNGALIHDTDTYIVPALIWDLEPEQPFLGVLELVIDYGRAGQEAERRIDVAARLSMQISGRRSEFYWIRQNDEPSHLGFDNKTPQWT